MEDSEGRRRFLKSVGALGAATIPAAAGAQQHAHGAAKGEKYMFLSAAEVAFLDAAVARLIPADNLGPGAKEARVTYFIDQQLFGGFGTMAKMYTQNVERYAVPYDALPISIVDILENKATLDETGHPKHVLLVRKD